MSTQSAPSSTERPAPPDPPRLRISLTQLVASALAAITATFAASFLGVAGTVIGAAVASLLTVTGNAVYLHSLQRTGSRVREAVPAAARWAARATPPAPAARTGAPPPVGPTRPRAHGTWAVVAAACVGVFAGVLVVVTAVELAAGKPLSDVVRGEQGSGTTVLGPVGQPGASKSPRPSVTVTVTPSVVTSTPTVTVTGAPVTRTSTPGATTTPTSTTTPRQTPTQTPTQTSGVSTSRPAPTRSTAP